MLREKRLVVPGMRGIELRAGPVSGWHRGRGGVHFTGGIFGRIDLLSEIPVVGENYIPRGRPAGGDVVSTVLMAGGRVSIARDAIDVEAIAGENRAIRPAGPV